MKKTGQAERKKKETAAKVKKAGSSPQAAASFPVVGLGASAGGLEALEQFLKNVPAESGLAFIVVQHLDPTNKGMLPELLQRVTTMKVVQVKNRTRVVPDHVYVIPPNTDMSILHGMLHLLEPASPRGLRMPIDFFLRSLAEDLRERSVGVILSGMGTDGTLGLKMIKEQAGLVLVQEPASAKYDGMPCSAINAGLADIVAPVAELPEKLLAYLKHAPLLARSRGPGAEVVQGQLEKVVILLRSHTGHDFSLYKQNTLYRRVERRMGLHHLPKISAYVRYLRENPQEIELLFKELLIGVTSFFRDPASWDQLREVGIPALLANRASGHTLRAWVTGCSTGEEAYSLAIVFKEALEKLKPRRNFSLQIFATDLDRDAVDKARMGFFPSNIAEEVSAERLNRFFIPDEQGYRVTKEIREMVIFAPQNLIMDPPFTKLDLLSCRNLLIYLSPELQKKLFPLFHYSLNPGGVLFLGSAESIGSFTGLFAPFGGKPRLFRRKEVGLRPQSVEFPSGFVSPFLSAAKAGSEPVIPPASLQAQVEQWLLQHHLPASVLVNDQGDILFIHGRTGRFLEPAAGKANWNIFVMTRERLRYEMTSAFQHARRQKGVVTMQRIKAGADGATYFVDISVQFFEEPEALCGLAIIVFTEVAAPSPGEKSRVGKTSRNSALIRELEEELQRARQEVQSTREEMQTSQEELKSMNEELQSTNEETQSANEELTTSKEEMQSLNEELQTVNAELQAKVDELSIASNDMKNLLNSTEIAIVFLDNDLHVRRFTEQATRIIKLIPGDIGRPITDLASDLLYPELVEDARTVLRTLVFVEKPVSTRSGRWFAMRLMPYRTMDNRIDGIVITFTDMSLARKLAAELKQQEAKTKKGTI